MRLALAVVSSVVVSSVLVATTAVIAGTRSSQPVSTPATLRHHITAGDTLSEIAERYGASIDRLSRVNDIASADSIRAGQVLTVRPNPRWWRQASTAVTLRGLAAPARGFNFPVGGGTASGYYNAQPFGDNDHLGDDWNGVGGGNTDLGDAVLAAAGGVVCDAGERGRGWGKVVRIVHNAGSASEPRWVETLYAHFDEIEVATAEVVQRGQRIGTIGTADGRYKAHLHFEVRDVLDGPLGRGYSKKTRGWLDPTAFIRSHRR